MCMEEWPRGHIIERMEGLHQGNPLQFHSFGFVGEYVFVEPVHEEVHMLLISICNGGMWAEDTLGKRENRRKHVKDIP